MKDGKGRELLTRIAWMYYLGGMNQQEIADEFSFTRVKVTRLLKQAVECGIVHITIGKSYFSLFSLENELKKVSGLRYCIVVPSVGDLVDALSRGLAYLCGDIIGIRGNLGVGLSRSLNHVALYLDKKKCRINSVVSICGTTTPNLSLKSVNSGYSIAQALGVEFYTIWAPVIVGPEVNGKAIMQDRYISMVLEMANNVDYALVGIGNADASQLIESKYISDDDYKSIMACNVEGEILGHYFTIDGTVKPTIIDDRLISVDLPMKCPVLAAAGGPAKIRVITGAIRSGLIQGLVTDEKTAIAVTAMLKTQ
jgi:DNA-binding transcriptional regulator LsrR (DeoR family)